MRDDYFQAYVNEVTALSDKYGMLSREDESALSDKISLGDRDAINKLIESNLRLVFFIAKKFHSRKTCFNELVSAGNIGLIRAAEKFDAAHNCKFSTYAYIWIERKMLDYKLKSEFVGSKHLTSRYFKIMKMINSYYIKHGKRMSIETISKEMELDIKDIQTSIDLGSLKFSSLNTTSFDGEEINMEELLPDTSIQENEDRMLSSDIAKIVSNMIETSKLNDREVYIVSKHFGIGESKGINFVEISKLLKISSTRVAALFDRSMKKLKYQAAKTGVNKNIFC